MNRVEFTHQIVNLLAAMMLDGEHPIIDYVKRSPEEQNRLFKAGASKCDGINTISNHQLGKAMDIYFMEDGEVVDSKKGWEYWHKYWEGKGGKPIIEWDKGHFEG
jgi:hypothetical protein